jgi:hypothetical protein
MGSRWRRLCSSTVLSNAVARRSGENARAVAIKAITSAINPDASETTARPLPTSAVSAAK